jgi:hypothetical protein
MSEDHEQVYAITNPSDPYTIKGADKAALCVAVLVLGEGRYGLVDKEGETLMPILAFGGDAISWLHGEMGVTNLERYIEKNGELLADCLGSIIIGDFNDRWLVEKSLENAKCEEDTEQILKEWHDKRRTSLNDIGATARKVAEIFRMHPGD